MLRIFYARDVLTYLFSEAKEWKEDGDVEDGVTRVYHQIRLSDGLLEELLDMAGIKKAGHDETSLETLKRASEDNTPAEAFIYDQVVSQLYE